MRAPSPRLLAVGLLGFFSGLPLALTAGTLTAWLADAGVERTAIGLFAAIGTPYALKFLWAPLLDGVRLPWLSDRFGRRRGWLLLSQSLLTLALALMARCDPAAAPLLCAACGVWVATLSATQDTIIDATRVELLPAQDQGRGAAWATFGYRLGMLASGAGALAMADRYGWPTTYLAMAAIASLSLPLTLALPRPLATASLPATRSLRGFMRDYVVAPMRDLATRPHWAAILLFIVIYKLADAVMGVMFNPFLLDLGFSKTQIAQIVKLYGLVATLLGSFAGGWAVARAGTYRTLMLTGMGHILTNLLLVVLASRGPDVALLRTAITLENFTGGMATAAFVAYVSGLCARHYTATQYALLSSLAAFGRTWLSTPAGALSAALGWADFFLIASLLGLPGLALLRWLHRRDTKGAIEEHV